MDSLGQAPDPEAEGTATEDAAPREEALADAWGAPTVADAQGELPAELAGPAGRKLVRRARRQLLLAVALANLVGVAVVVACIAWVLPGGQIDDVATVIAVNAVMAGIFLVLVVPVGVIWGEAWLRSGRRWIQENRAPTDAEVTAVLQAPMRLFFVHATMWLVAAAIFAVLNGLIEIELLPRVAFTVALGGLTTSAVTYLVAERITRPLAKAALSIRSVRRPRLPGVTTRTMLGWALGTGVPLVGLVIVGIFALAEPEDASRTQLAVTMLVLGGTALFVGWWVMVLGARAIAEHIGSLRRAIAQLADGDFDTRVEVSDGSVLGLLQSGFNDMAAGLQEREALRDLYGRQVGVEVALDALERGTALGGELRTVSVLFVDVVGSTRLAATLPAAEVVARLNRFFGVVVDVVHDHGGWVNKFQGDATLVVFGAPAELDDPASRALAAARILARRLPAEVPELEAGIGVAHGQVVAGNIGDERRFEFTVIGDPVNEASRLTELAKARRPMVLASAEAVDAASVAEQARWVVDGTAELRGRTRPTRLATPR